MNQIWDKFKWALTHVSWVLAGLILLIDPKHIDEIAASHPKVSALILVVWGALVAWANKPRPGLFLQVGRDIAENLTQGSTPLQGAKK